MNRSVVIWLVVAAVLIWYFLRDSLGVKEMKQLDLFYSFIIFIAVACIAFYYWSKARSPHIVTPTVCESFTEEPIAVGNWLVFQVGGVKYMGLDGSGAYIIHKDHAKYNLRNYYTRARLDKIHYLQVPLEVRNLLKERKIDNEKIWWGKNLWETEVKDPFLTVKQVSERLDEHDQNYTREVLERVADTIDSSDAMAEEKTKRFNKDSIVDSVKETLREKINPPGNV